MALTTLGLDSVPSYLALSTDISGGAITGASVVGKLVYLTDTATWKIIKNDLQLADYTYPVGNTGGVSRSGATTDGHLAIWNGSSADSIKDGGAITAFAPSTSNYVTTSSDSSLSSEKIISQLINYSSSGYPANPDSKNDEFDTGSLNVLWTVIGSPNTTLSSYIGYYFIEDNHSSACGIRKAFAPSANTAFTVAIKILPILNAAFSNILFAVETSTPTSIAALGIQNANNGLNRFRSLNNASETNPAFVGTDYSEDSFIIIQRDTSNVYTLKYSPNGTTWHTISSFTNSATVANISIIMDSQGAASVNSSFAIDYIRFFSSITEVVGSSPT